MTDRAIRHEDYPPSRPPVTLYEVHQRQIEAVLLGLLERHPEEGEAVDRVRRVLVGELGEE